MEVRLHGYIPQLITSQRSLWSFRAKFCWAIVRLRLMPIGGDDRLEGTRAVLVASLIEGYTIDFGHIIADELFFRARKTHTALPFPCLITELCRRANVSLISGVDNEVPAIHTQDIERTKDWSRFDLRTNRPPAQQTQSAPVPEPSDFPAGMPM